MRRIGILILSFFLIPYLHAQELPGYVQDMLYLSTIPHIDSISIRKELKTAAGLANEKPDSAVAIYKRTLLESRQVQFTTGIISSLGNMGNVYNSQGQYEQSRQAYMHAIPYCFGTIYGKNNISSLYNGIGLTYASCGDYENAIKYYYISLALAEDIPTSVFKPALVYNNLSIVLIQLGQYDKALEYLNKQEAIARLRNDDSTLAYIYTNKANLYNRINDLDNCYKYSKLAWNNGKHNSNSRYCSLIDIAYYYIKKDTPAKALVYLLNANKMNVNASIGDKCTGNYSLGEVYYILGNYKKAEEYLLLAQNEGLAANLTPELLLIYNELSDVYEKVGNYKRAYVYAEKGRGMQDSVASVAKSTAIAQLEIKYQAAEKDKALFAGQLRINGQQNVIKNKNLWIIGITAGAALIAVALAMVFVLYKNNRNKQKLQAQEILSLQQEQEIMQLKAIMAGEERERTRLARELHDGVGGMLTCVNMNINAVRNNCTDMIQAKKLDNILHMLRDTSAEVRKTAHNLMPEVLNRYGLKDALLVYCEHINGNGKLRIDLQCHGDFTNLNKATQLLLYRFAQELVQNIVKHSNATQGDVQIMMNDNKLTVNVEDNGDGFDIQEQTGGYGLQNLKFRVQALHGYISVTSARGHSTTVYIEFDMDQLNKHIAA